MTTSLQALTRPKAGAAPFSRTKHAQIGLLLGLLGVVLVTAAFFGNLSAAGDSGTSAAQTLAWTFGLTTLGFGTVKMGIAVILIGILVSLWTRVDSVQQSLPHLRAPAAAGPAIGSKINTPYGVAAATEVEPKPLPIHRMAKTMWAPMLAMGAMALVAGFIVSLAWSNAAGSGDATTAAAAWTQGLQFLGEGLLLSGISFLLGTILASLREGGGRVQQSLGLTVQTLKMPTTAKIFIGLMMMGLMISVVQFVLYIVVANGVSDPAAWFAILGPLREVGLGLLLAGIVMALATIGNVLGFQFHRIRQICTIGS